MKQVTSDYLLGYELRSKETSGDIPVRSGTNNRCDVNGDLLTTPDAFEYEMSLSAAHRR